MVFPSWLTFGFVPVFAGLTGGSAVLDDSDVSSVEDFLGGVHISDPAVTWSFFNSLSSAFFSAIFLLWLLKSSSLSSWTSL